MRRNAPPRQGAPAWDKPVPYEGGVEAQQFAQANCQRARKGAPAWDKLAPYEGGVEAQQFAQANCQRARKGAPARPS